MRVKSSHDGGLPSAQHVEVDEAATAGESADPASAAALAASGLAYWLHQPPGTSATGGPIASRFGQISWAMFECARIPYVLLVTIYLFGPYFTKVVVGDPVHGQILWSRISWMGGLAIAVCAPFLGAIADVGGRRKPWIAIYTAVMVVAMLAMWAGMPNASTLRLVGIAAAIIAANFAYEFSTVFHSAMLPTIAPHERVGALSGLSLSLGNLAGILLLGFMLFAFSAPGHGLPFVPDYPLFGVSQEAHDPERLSGPISGVWLLIVSLPLFLFTPDKPSTGVPLTRQMRLGVGRVVATVRSLRQYRNIAMYLLARLFFNDGMGAVLLYGGIYAAVTFSFDALAMMVYGLELSMFAVLGGFFGGWLDDTIGSKRALFVSVGGTLLFFSAGLTMAPDRILWFIHYDVHSPPINGLPFFNTWPQLIYLFIVNGVAVFITAGYANARTMMARLAPPEKMTEFFGLMSLSGTATTFLANLSIDLLTTLSGSLRGGLLGILGFLTLGLVLMGFVKEERAAAI